MLAGQRKGDADADELAAEAAELSVEEAAAGPWEAAWDATMEGSAASRAKGAAAMCALLQKGYERRAAEEQCALAAVCLPYCVVACAVCCSTQRCSTPVAHKPASGWECSVLWRSSCAHLGTHKRAGRSAWRGTQRAC